jgi:hypothetical protein
MIRKIQIGESTLWYLQNVWLFFTGYLRGTVEWGVQEVKGWIWNIKFERFRLIPLYSIFLNSKEGDRIMPRGRSYIVKPRKLFVYMCD